MLNAAITLTEVRAAMGAARTGRAAGPDGFSVDMLHAGGPAMLRALLTLFTATWNSEHVPDAWLLAYVVPIYKGSGARGDPASYRPIALMASVAKLYEKVLHDRIAAHVQRTHAIGDEQAAFRRQRGCIDHLYVLHEIVSQRREQHKHTYLAFLDLRAAYDTTWRDGVWKRLLDVGVVGKVWRVVVDM